MRSMRRGTNPVTVRVPNPPEPAEQADQRLHLNQHRAVPFEHRDHRRAGNPRLPVGQQQPRRIVQRLDAALGHAEHADPVGGAKPVLDHPQQAQSPVAVALEVHHRVDRMLQHARAGQATVLGDVSHEDNRSAAAPGGSHKRVGGRAPG